MDSDSYSEAGPEQPSRRMPRRAAKLKEPVRLTRSAVVHMSQSSASDAQPSEDETTRHDISSSHEDDTGDEDGNFTMAHSGQKRKKTSHILTAASKRTRRSNPSGSRPRSSSAHPSRGRPGRPAVRSPAKKSHQDVGEQTTIVVPGDWQHLPALVWENIFDFVAIPISDPTARKEDISIAIRTLRNATKAGRPLVEPAIAARYRCIHLEDFASAQDLSRILAIDPDQTALYIRYRSKIKSLRIEVHETLSKRVQGQYVTLWELIRNLPTLVDVELYHKTDLSYTRDDLEKTVRWKYPDELLDALAFVPDKDPANDYRKKEPTKLESWTWSSRLANESYSLEKLVAIHQTPSFATLRKIKFINYQVPSLSTKVDDEAAMAMDLPEIRKLATAISALPNLEHLAFKSSTMVNNSLLSLLPKTLKHLELQDCYDVTSDALRDFLLAHGHWIQQLTLDHCRGLNLDFLTVLKGACPNLTHLSMDMTYHRYIESYPDNEPEYKVLLGPGQVPTWPPTLQYLNIQPMRSWGPAVLESATTFFRSLTDSASDLPHLRHISLKLKINALRNERYKFKRTWIPKFDNIFKRTWEDPKPQPRRRFVIPIQTVSRSESRNSDVTPARRSTRIAERPPTPTPTSPADEVAESSKRARLNMLRVRKETRRLRLPGKMYHADNEESEDELSMNDSDFTRVVPIFKQRLCDVVDVHIDNGTVTEYQFTENDFLDTPNDTEDEDYQD
ncbi:hypothetical protein BKA67DRAFT_654591 [Truncatella angustata]|uniref:Uncharacterized protein n=1 Tax=Truncatella angustata TaxID=152316 RepID=A0A9P8UQH5_9PEZI|nr:uncharacterized protein BKA67DRAFT_654591 [Truncatella angustata]KAH6656242.1 hypothetical protein BKA67DRAFT_654591 [Truncatella angustata]